MTVLTALFCTGCAPILHVLITKGTPGLKNFALGHTFATTCSYLVGTIFYVSHFPERYKPGSFHIIVSATYCYPWERLEVLCPADAWASIIGSEPPDFPCSDCCRPDCVLFGVAQGSASLYCRLCRNGDTRKRTVSRSKHDGSTFLKHHASLGMVWVWVWVRYGLTCMSATIDEVYKSEGLVRL